MKTVKTLICETVDMGLVDVACAIDTASHEPHHVVFTEVETASLEVRRAIDAIVLGDCHRACPGFDVGPLHPDTTVEVR